MLEEDAVAAASARPATPSTQAPAAPAQSRLLGIAVVELTAAMRQQMGLAAGEGVGIAAVTGTAAREASLQEGLVILRVGRTPVGSVAQFNTALRGVSAGDVVMLLVRHPSSGATQFVAVSAGPAD